MVYSSWVLIGRAAALATLAMIGWMATSALAETGTTPATVSEKPVLVVWARTDLANGGQPTLDLIDLERYFVARLAERYIPTAYPSTTTKISTPAPANVYLVELSVN